MAHCNKGLNNIYTRTAKPDSKTQQNKREYAESHPKTYVVCEECGAKDRTLYKRNSKYYCKEHIPEIIENNT